MTNDKTTRTLLIASARTLFLEKGYDRTPVEEICELAGMAKGTFFYHFATKQYLVQYLMDMQLQDMMADINRAMADCGRVEDKLRSFIVMLIAADALPPESAGYFKEQPEWFYKLFDDARYKYFFPVLVNILEEGVESGLFRIKCVEALANLLFLGINAYLHANFERMESDQEYRREALEGIDELVSKTLGLRPFAFRLAII